MNILATQYTLSTKSLEIYIAGCNGNPHCINCHNSKSWNYNIGETFSDNYFKNNILSKIKRFDLIDNIMIFGGEPLDRDIWEDYGLVCMFVYLADLNLPIWLFTRYELEEIPDIIKSYCDYIKCGKYIEELTTDDNIQYGIKLATSNQKIYKKAIDY